MVVPCVPPGLNGSFLQNALPSRFLLKTFFFLNIVLCFTTYKVLSNVKFYGIPHSNPERQVVYMRKTSLKKVMTCPELQLLFYFTCLF